MSALTRRMDETRGRAAASLVVAVIVLTVAVPAVAAAVSGNLAIPHNDAWAYSLIAEHFSRTGTIRLVGWSHPFSLGQVIALGPLGRSLVAQQLFVVFLTMVALGGTFVLLCRRLSLYWAAFGTAVLGAFPGFGLLATSFMGDLPTYCAMVVALLVGLFAIKRGSVSGLAVAVAVGVWAITIRDQAIAVVAAVLISAFVAWPDRSRRSRLAALAAIAVLCVATLEIWRRSLANGQSPHIVFSWHTGWTACVEEWFTLGLLILPAAAVGVRPSAWSWSARGIALLTGLVGVAFHLRFHTVFAGNYLDQHGAYYGTILGTHVVLPKPVWDMLELGGWIGGILLAGALVDRLRMLDLTLLMFGLFIAAGIVLPAFASEPTYDRFLLPVVPVILLVVLDVSGRGRLPKWRPMVGGGLLAVLFVTSLVITGSALAFDSARWRTAQTLVRGGINPQMIDAGFEWVGYHSPVPAVNARPSKERAIFPWYARILFPHAPECYVVTSSPVSGLGQITLTFAYRPYLVFGHSHLLVYDTGRCPPRKT